jgi:hypothetical protein
MNSSVARRLRGVAVLLGAFALVGCTSSLIYNRLDTIARWYIGSLVSLDEAQQASLRDWLSRSLAWHRDSELKRYEHFLRDLAGKVSTGPDPTLLPTIVQQTEAFVGEMAARMAPEAAQLLTTLRPPQVEEFLDNLEKRNREELDEERGRTPADRQKRRIRSMTKTLEKWTGSATAEQKALLEHTVNDMGAAGLLGETDEWFASQTAWRDALRQALAKGAAGSDEVEALLRDPQTAYTESHRAAEAEQRRRFLVLATELDASLSPKQRATLAAKLTDLAQDLKSLQ